MTDSLLLLFEETRRQCPPVWSDEWASWLQTMGQVIAGCPLAHRQWAWKIAISSDLYRAWDGRYSIAVAYGEVEEAVREASGVGERRCR